MATDQPPPPTEPARRRLFTVETVCAAGAAVLRAIAVAAQWNGNPAVRNPSLDASYYLDWARAIGDGALLSAGPVGANEPYLLNPLYAWVMAPLSVFGGGLQLAVLVLHIALGAATTWLTAAAARRHAGPLAAWIAGGAVAASTALVHLSTHVSVATLAAFLVAGAVYSCAPPHQGERGHGGVAAGVWLGLGALARPVVMLALPLIAFLYYRRAGSRAALLVILLFCTFAGGTLLRNSLVAGESVPFTAANGLNLHLGQNPLARQTGSMLTNDFRFSPVKMHQDAKHRVGFELGREPSRSEISSWYRDATIEDVRENPTDAFRFAVLKARWFLSPEEPPSSADLRIDRDRVPWLHVGFVATWMLVVAGIAGAWFARGDKALLLGAGGLVLAHVAACTLVFPLSHYRAPAIPALAVLAGVGIATVLRLPRRTRVHAALVGGVLALVAHLPPQPGTVLAVFHLNTAVDALRDNAPRTALNRADLAIESAPGWTQPFCLKTDAYIKMERFDLALDAVERAIEGMPWDASARRIRSGLLLELDRPDEALAVADQMLEIWPWSYEALGTRGSVRAWTGDLRGAREDLRRARDLGFEVPRAVLQVTGPLD